MGWARRSRRSSGAGRMADAASEGARERWLKRRCVGGWSGEAGHVACVLSVQAGTKKISPLDTDPERMYIPYIYYLYYQVNQHTYFYPNLSG